MTKDLRERLEEQWPALAARLRGFLVRKGVRPARREDVVQETATRLVSMWHAVDHDRDPWPLVKTIALNLLRDEARRRYEELPSELPDIPFSHDAERALMAHLELARVRRALEELSPAHRSVLLAEAGEGCAPRGSDAEKMMRMRARKHLKELMKKLPGLLPLRLRLLDAGQLFAGLRDLALPGLACIACFSLIPGPLAPPRVLYGAPDSLPAEMLQLPSAATSIAFAATALPDDLTAVRTALAGSADVTSGSRKKAKGSAGEAGNDALPLPGMPEAPQEVPTVEGVPVVSPAEAEPPPAPEAPLPDEPLLPGDTVPIMLDPVYQAIDPNV